MHGENFRRDSARTGLFGPVKEFQPRFSRAAFTYKNLPGAGFLTVLRVLSDCYYFQRLSRYFLRRYGWDFLPRTLRQMHLNGYGSRKRFSGNPRTPASIANKLPASLSPGGAPAEALVTNSVR